MPPENHEIIYGQLASVTERIALALQNMEPDELMALAEDHQHIMNALHEAGTCTDVRLLDQIQMLNSRISQLMADIRHCQHDISTRMKEIADGKKIMHAYAQ
ncbi:MAG: hypothetical protein AB7S77_23490 [Desulfatirhabdiaceae bacterium]